MDIKNNKILTCPGSYFILLKLLLPRSSDTIHIYMQSTNACMYTKKSYLDRFSEKKNKHVFTENLTILN